MADWVLIPCLKALFAEFNRIAPRRDKTTDGSIGDPAHRNRVSDHNPDETGAVPIHDADRVNEVHAIDVDKDLNESDLTMEKVVQFLINRCRNGSERRLRYVIYNKRIWSASSGWVQKSYTGASPHTGHAHFSASYDTNLEASTASWHLEDIPVALTAADKAWITNTIATQTQKAIEAKLAEIAKEVLLDYRINGTQTPGSSYQRNLTDLTGDVWFATMVGTTRGGDPLPPDGAFSQIMQDIAELSAKVDELAARLDG
ncbi:hypothetical protein [Paractinoplanes rishiriensis]|uniref:Uncharacterized protein n=1 Tax=Paractinoplanes rishiriensis TaxID=1050105 RepID=A0A919MUQ7_9ACTN|nr:hypothetical protein [Actinoplanes rishiriensis]GIE95604.1 hypothetical protein Ari01nite_30690 [Actinoplanes rishiriensis]